MTQADPDAVWLMQGWAFLGWHNNSNIEAYLGEVPDDKLIILDLWSEGHSVFNRAEGYFGK